MFFYFNLIFGYKLVILIYFFFVDAKIKLTYTQQKNIRDSIFYFPQSCVDTIRKLELTGKIK